MLYYMFHAPLGDGRYYQAEVTNKHLASWKMRKSDFHNFVLEHSLVSMESKIYPLCEKIENVLEGISCCLNNGEAEDSLVMWSRDLEERQVYYTGIPYRNLAA